MSENTHGIPRKYSKQFDAFYDPETKEWIEPQCTDLECRFCKDRPVNAIGVDANADEDATRG